MDSYSRFGFTPTTSILLLLFLVAIGFVLFLALGVLVAAIVTGNWELATLLSGDYFSSQGLIVLRILQIFQTTGVFLFPAVAFAVIVSKGTFAMLGFKSIKGEILWLSAIFIIIAMPAINLLASLNAEVPLPQWMIEKEQAGEALTRAFMITNRFDILALNLFMVGVLPALGEELFFRGVLQKFFCRILKSNLWGIIITALIFSAIHMQFLGFIPRFLLGLIFGFLYVWSGSIWAPIFVHFLHNSLAVLGYFFIGKGIIPAETETIGGFTELWQLGVASLVLSAVMIWFIRKKSSTGV